MSLIIVCDASMIESGYVFHKRSLFFWKKQENHGVFFDFWQRYMVAKKSVASSLPFFAVFLEKNEKNDLEPEIQVNFSFVNLSILIAFWENIPYPRKKTLHPKQCFLERYFKDRGIVCH